MERFTQCWRERKKKNQDNRFVVLLRTSVGLLHWYGTHERKYTSSGEKNKSNPTWMTPPPKLSLRACKNSEGKPIILPSQSITNDSNSVQAGLEACDGPAIGDPMINGKEKRKKNGSLLRVATVYNMSLENDVYPSEAQTTDGVG